MCTWSSWLFHDDTMYSSLSGCQFNLSFTVPVWHLLLFSCTLSPCANQWGWFCVLGSCHSLYNVFLGFITSCPNLLSCFVSSCPSLPPLPLSYCFPPYRLCVCHICYQGNGTECNQNHASLSDYGGTVPLSTYFSFPSSPSYILLPPCAGADGIDSSWSMSHI